MPRRLVPGTGVRVEVPASSANLGPGFDTLGLALELRDTVAVQVTGDRLVVEVVGEGAEEVPRDASHLVVACLLEALHRLGVEPPAGLKVVCRNVVPHSRGLGSSAAAAVAGYAAASALVGPLDRDLVNDLAGAREGHPDNSSASVFGGMTLSWTEQAEDVGEQSGSRAVDKPARAEVAPRVRTVRLHVHPDVVPVVLVPDTALSTATARAALPAQVAHGDAAANAGRAALLVEALTRRPQLLLPATQDRLHQEQRRADYPATMTLVDRLRAAGHAAVVSGAGPTVLVLTTATNLPAVQSFPLAEGWLRLLPGLATEGVVARPLPA
ncbi:homoserine kinase [Arsenicicoccus dermatophilus]|uniref:homoserine kinase n=1 Tax=Arsenicicoccus dermatophilus TaxID=1076331 RepID=UPI003916D81E